MPQSASPQFFLCDWMVFSEGLSSYKDANHTGWGAHHTSVWLDLKSATTLKVRSCSEILALRMSTSFFFLWRGDAIQHTTIYIWKYGRNKISKLGIFIFVSFLLFFFPSSLSLSFVFLLFPFSLLPSLPLSFLSHLLLIAPFFSFLISLAIVSWWGGTNRTRRHWVDVCKKRLVHSQRNMTHNEKDSLPVLLGNLTHSIMEFWRWRKKI